MKRIILALLTISSISSICFADTPVNNFADKVVNGNETTLKIYSYPKYYDNNGNFEAVDNSIIASNDVGWDWEVKKGVYKLRIKNDGTFEINHMGDIISQKLEGLGFFNQSTKERVVRSAPTLSNPTVSGNTITWSLPLGSSYKLEYSNDNFKDVLTISNDAKQWLNARRPAGWQTADIWMGLIYDMDLTNSSMIESKDFETDGGVKFITNGKIKHFIKATSVKHSLYEDEVRDVNGNVTNADKTALKWTKKKFYRNGKYIEAIPVAALDSADGNLIFNTDITFQEGVSPNGSYTGTEDTGTNSSNTTINYGNATTVSIKWQFSSHNGRMLIRFNVSDIPSTATINSATLNIKTSVASTSCVFYAYRLFKPWVEGNGTSDVAATNTDWNAPNQEWGSAKADNASDAGDDNTGDGTDYDRKATAEDDSTISSNTMSFTITNAVQNWVDGNWDNNGVIITMSGTCGSSDAWTATTSENGTSANRPELLVTYTVPSSDRRTIMILD